ncbi:MAG: polyphenol oxidase family protein [bacterium]
MGAPGRHTPGPPRSASHPPIDTLLPLLVGIDGVRSGVSRRPVDAADRVAGLRWVSRAAGVPPRRVALLEQVHGSRVVTVPWEGFPRPVEGDALVTGETGLALSVRIADCAPVALAAPDGSAVGMVHAGWRGLKEGVVPAGVGSVAEVSGCAPGELLASIGPALGGCCYEVGEEFEGYSDARYLRRVEGGLLFDLPAAVRDALEAAGVGSENIQTHASACTACGTGAPEGVEFHSHRASAGGPGRNTAFILKAGPGGNV